VAKRGKGMKTSRLRLKLDRRRFDRAREFFFQKLKFL